MAKKIAKKKIAPKKKATPKKKPVARKVAKKAPAKPAVNKSKAIRDYQTKNPNAGPTAVAEALGKEGIEVTPAFVSTVKTLDKTKKKAGRKTKARVGELTVANLMQAKELAQALGGPERAKAALEALDKLQK